MEDIRFISYLDDDGKKVIGTFKIISIKDNFIIFISHDNEITIPIQRLLKIKKNLKGGLNKN